MANVLIVLDDDFRFTVPTAQLPDFTYSALVNTLLAGGHTVTRAHRGTDPSADLQNFKFDGPTSLGAFDMMWLIGLAGRNSIPRTGSSGAGISDTEVRAIARYMAAGGGVFATGDHDSIGAEMCGRIPRVRSMRAWYGANDGASPMPASFPRNNPVVSSGRADTTRRSPGSNYGGDTSFVWFENQSDALPQQIAPLTSPAHPILRRGGSDIVIYPDHMHEGKTLGEVAGYAYTQSLSFAGESFDEYPMMAGNREMPKVIAQGTTNALKSKSVKTGDFVGNIPGQVPNPEAAEASALKTVDTLCVYDGRTVGVGRIVTGSTFHHYVDINLTGDSGVTGAAVALAGTQAQKGHGFNDDPPTFDLIKQVFLNITDWLARPRPRIQLVLERSTFSQAEAGANPDFEGAILVIVDGVKPGQFPGGGVTSLNPASFQAAWAPTITAADPQGLAFTPTAVASDDPDLNDRLQRLTFTYQVHVTNPAFGFGGNSKNIRIDATLATPAAPAAVTDHAWIQMTKSANPFMLDLANGNDTAWLSSDVRVFPVVAGTSKFGVTLPLNATRADALAFLNTLLASISVAEFESLSMTQQGSALSPFPTGTLDLGIFDLTVPVFNFAVARVRLPAAGATADDVRVFFRIFTSQTTAALTYREAPAGTPIEGYKRTAGSPAIALPGTNGAGNEWVSFPMFANARAGTPSAQTDPTNLKSGLAPGSNTFFGALIDNNLGGGYLPAAPGGSGSVDLPTLLMGEHQCLVAQIEFGGTPIPNEANPLTSDKLAQRNIALSAIANPGLDASRMALHTFELEASPNAAGGRSPDELLLDWLGEPPDGTEVEVHLPGVRASEIIELADRLYARHDLRVVDEHTVGLPGGGVRYLPLPSSSIRQTGVLSAHLPLGIVKGQRFDLAVRQITTRGRLTETRPPKVTEVTRAEATKLLRAAGYAPAPATAGAAVATTTRRKAALPKGVFELGKNKVLVTDLSIFDAAGDHALVIEQPDRRAILAAERNSGIWRETLGAFQLGMPVAHKGDMLVHHLRLLSVLRWRADRLRPRNRWYLSFRHYVDLIADKVRALGGDPWSVPATSDGIIDLSGLGGGQGPGTAPGGGTDDPHFDPGPDDWLGDTGGLPDAVGAKAGTWSGKVSGLLFDHFGDFEGFTLERYAGTQMRFFSREAAVLELARSAWRERFVVTVITVSGSSRRVRRLLLRGYSD